MARYLSNLRQGRRRRAEIKGDPGAISGSKPHLSFKFAPPSKLEDTVRADNAKASSENVLSLFLGPSAFIDGLNCRFQVRSLLRPSLHHSLN